MRRTDPIQAYQRGVAQQAALKQQEQNIKLRQAQEERLRAAETRLSNPFYEYEMFQQKFPEQAKDMTFAEFSQLGLKPGDRTSQQKNLAEYMRLNPNATQEDIQKFFAEAVRAGTPYQAGGGAIYRHNPITGERTLLVDAPTATGREATLAGAKEGATQGEKTRAEQVRAGLTGASQARVANQTAEEMLSVTDDWIEKFSGANPPDTGVVTKFMAEFLGIGTEEIGDLSAESIKSGLTNLGLANLAPVTEQEFANVLRLWASLGSSPEMNLGALRNAKRRTERLMDMIREDAIYSAGLVEEYGTEGQRGAFLRANPYIRDLMTDPEPTGTIKGPSRPGG
jgi:hypothetical protein